MGRSDMARPGGSRISVPALAGVLLACCLAAGTARPLQTGPLAPGRFGMALDAGKTWARAQGGDRYTRPPLTVECWARLRSKAGFNILVACEPKASATHWELYTYAGSGCLSFYLPGCTPGEVVSSTDVTDGRWHHLAATFDGSLVRLFVDGREAAARTVARLAGAERRPGPLAFGAIAEDPGLRCDGLIDEVRISDVVRPIAGLPTAPFVRDARTLGLWHFDASGPGGRLADASAVANTALASVVVGRSMDDVDRGSYRAGPPPFDTPATAVRLHPGAARHPAGPPVLTLDGTWQMAEGGDERHRLSGDWPDAIPAAVPGSVHGALLAAGRIPDPKFGRNDAIAHAQSFKTWWFRRTFAWPAGAVRPRLVFGGVAIHCTVWLNGRRLGSHEGMFGGPEFSVDGLLRDRNVLAVRIDPAPGDPNAWNNPDWRKTVVFNNVWGWHYSSIPALGIWRPVRIVGSPAVQMADPFVAARDARAGIVDLVVGLAGPGKGRVVATIQPETFRGPAYHFEYAVAGPPRGRPARSPLHLRVRVPAPRLWWPNGLGRPDLYRLRLSFVPAGAGQPDTRETTFGIRTIRMAPLPGGPRTDRYNWTFAVNGRPVFVKGTGWCTMDSSMDFRRERYDRFLELARLQNVQMVRGWGSGMPETDEFYDLCDRKGIMVLQEWPTAWDSHLVQPYGVLAETVRLNTLRLRNHPSLAMYGGGNESGNPFGKAIDMMGRAAIELDGTRPFHRGEPWGGSQHNYNCYWGRQPLDHNLNMVAPFFGEFGLACMPVKESVLRYLPGDENTLWPPRPDGSLAHHTPIFNTAEDVSRLTQYSAYFTPGRTLGEFVTGSQLSQVVGLRHTLERARTRWPDCSGALYYKLNDNYPAASWSTVDWYGAPKLGHYFVQSAFAPLHACVIFDSVNVKGRPLSLPVYLLDDADRLHGASWEVRVRAYGGTLAALREWRWRGQGATGRVRKLGVADLTADQADAAPLFVVADVVVAGRLADRTYYFVNYEEPKGCLFALPRTRLQLRTEGGKAIVTNIGRVPAVGAAVLRPGHLDTFTADANYLWLEPGESRALGVSSTDGLTVEAWNG